MKKFFTLIIAIFIFSITIPHLIAVFIQNDEAFCDSEKEKTEKEEFEKEEIEFSDKILPVSVISNIYNNFFIKNISKFFYVEISTNFSKTLFSPPPENL